MVSHWHSYGVEAPGVTGSHRTVGFPSWTSPVRIRSAAPQTRRGVTGHGARNLSEFLPYLLPFSSRPSRFYSPNCAAASAIRGLARRLGGGDFGAPLDFVAATLERTPPPPLSLTHRPPRRYYRAGPRVHENQR